MSYEGRALWCKVLRTNEGKTKKIPKKERCSLDARPIPVTVLHSRPSRPRKPKKIPRKKQKNNKKNLDPRWGHEGLQRASAALREGETLMAFLDWRGDKSLAEHGFVALGTANARLACAWLLLCYCAAPRANHALRTIPPSLNEP